jgi:hypothetical protein
MNLTSKNAEPGGSLDAENVCGLSGLFFGGASDLNVENREIQSHSQKRSAKVVPGKKRR